MDSSYRDYVEVEPVHIPTTQELQCKRGALIAGAGVLGLLALGTAVLALSILFPPLAIPVVTGAIVATVGISSLATGLALLGISVGALAGTLVCSLKARVYTRWLGILERPPVSEYNSASTYFYSPPEEN